MRIQAAGIGIAIALLTSVGVVAQTNAPDDFLKFQNVTNAAVKAAGIRTFDGGLGRIDRRAKVRECTTMLVATPGRIETIYGGLCRLRSGQDVVVCGDTGIGEFALSEAFSATADGVAEFVRNNCPGG